MHRVREVIHKAINTRRMSVVNRNCQYLINNFVENTNNEKSRKILLILSVINIRKQIRNLRAVNQGGG